MATGNGIDILKTYDIISEKDGGWCELHTLEIKVARVPLKEDRQILKDMGWVQKNPWVWHIEWWN